MNNCRKSCKNYLPKIDSNRNDNITKVNEHSDYFLKLYCKIENLQKGLHIQLP